jgi:hypothetical protein
MHVFENVIDELMRARPLWVMHLDWISRYNFTWELNIRGFFCTEYIYTFI